MSRLYATPLVLEIFPSRLHHILLVNIQALVATSILFLSWDLPLRLLCVVIILSLHYYLLRRSTSCRHLVWQSGNGWLLTINNETIHATLLQESLVTSWLIILLFRTEPGRSLSVLIWADSVHADTFRKLRVRLKLEAEKLFANTG
jgi:hypothetical protein